MDTLALILFMAIVIAAWVCIFRKAGHSGKKFVLMNESSSATVIQSLNTRCWDEVVHHGVVLVDFSQPWCQPCRVQRPILEKVAERMKRRATVAVANIDDVRMIAVDLNVRSIPTLVLFEQGKVIRTFAGIHSEEEIVAELEAAVNHLKTACS